MLLEIAGKALILHTLTQAKKARSVSRVIVATDDARIINVVKENGGEAVMTSVDHASGSDRIAEVARDLPEGSIIVNVQGDEPMIAPETIDAAVDAFVNAEGGVRNAEFEKLISTTCEPITDEKDVLSSNVVKVVTDENGYALYFSRSPIPWPREAVIRFGTLENALKNESGLMSSFRKHTGIYVYRREYLLKFTKLPQSKLEKIEMLEQLRALENGARIKVVEVNEGSIGVDTPEDFERVKRLIEGNE